MKSFKNLYWETNMRIREFQARINIITDTITLYI